MGLFLPGNDRRWASYDLEVAEKLGLNEAIVLAQIIRSIECHIDKSQTAQFFRDGRWWMYDSMPALSKSTALGIDAIRRTIAKLKSLKIIQMFQYELSQGYAHYWYAIDKETLAKTLSNPPPRQNQRMGGTCAKPEDAPVQNHKVGYAKPQDATLAKPHDLSITHIPINPMTQTITPPTASVIALPIKKPRSKKEKPPIAPDLLQLGKAWHDFARENTKTKPYASWNDQAFGEALEKVIKSTGLSITKMSEILIFVKGDEFWKPNAISPQSLLKISASNGKRKIDNILDAMERSKQQPRGGNYERPKAVDYSADNGKFANCRDDKPW